MSIGPSPSLRGLLSNIFLVIIFNAILCIPAYFIFSSPKEVLGLIYGIVSGSISVVLWYELMDWWVRE